MELIDRATFLVMAVAIIALLFLMDRFRRKAEKAEQEKRMAEDQAEVHATRCHGLMHTIVGVLHDQAEFMMRHTKTGKVFKMTFVEVDENGDHVLNIYGEPDDE